MRKKPVDIISNLFYYILILLYSFLFTVLSPIIFFVFIFLKNMRKKVLFRFFPFYKKKRIDHNEKDERNKNKILVHVSSAGEASLAYNLFKNFVDYSFFNDAAYLLLRQKKVESYPLPFESLISLTIFFVSKKYETVILVEQEIWPLFITFAKIFKIKLIMINCNMYDRSFDSQIKLRFIYKKLFGYFDKIYARSDIDKKRLLSINKYLNVEVTENLKILSSFISSKIIQLNFDKFSLRYNIKDSIEFKNPDNSSILNKRNLVLIFASIHSEEFDILIDSMEILQNNLKKKLIIFFVPRYLQNINILKKKLSEKNFKFITLSEMENKKSFKKNTNDYIYDLILNISSSEDNTIGTVLIDRFGLLSELFKYGDISIVGGTFNNKGGQNFIEPLIYGVPAVIGPSYDNFSDLAAYFQDDELFKIDKKSTDFLYAQDIASTISLIDKNIDNIKQKLKLRVIQLLKIAEKQVKMIEKLYINF